jgi:phosphate transport system ATP-binding protein
MPPPVRRIAVDRDPHIAPPAPSSNGAAASAVAPAQGRRRLTPPGPATVRERMRIESVWLAYGENWVVRDVTLPVRQGEVLALIGA